MTMVIPMLHFKYTSDMHQLLILFPRILQFHQCSIRVLPDNGLVQQAIVTTAKPYKSIVTHHALHRCHLELSRAFFYKYIFLTTRAYYCIFRHGDTIISSYLYQCIHEHTRQEWRFRTNKVTMHHSTAVAI